MDTIVPEESKVFETFSQTPKHGRKESLVLLSNVSEYSYIKNDGMQFVEFSSEDNDNDKTSPFRGSLQNTPDDSHSYNSSESWLGKITKHNFSGERDGLRVFWSQEEKDILKNLQLNKDTAKRRAKMDALDEMVRKEKRVIDFEEGIFFFARDRGRCCDIRLPVDEETYLKHYKEWDLKTYLQQRVLQQTDELKVMQASSEWSFASKIIVCEANSLNLFSHRTKFRKLMVYVVEQKWFDNIVIVLILLNSIVLALYNYKDRDNHTEFNQWLNLINNIFSFFFICECTLKILAYGFVNHYNSYLRDPWNWLDFAVVVVSIVEMTPFKSLQLKPLRTLRVLRPLRSIKALPGMRTLIVSLIRSVPSLLQTVYFMVIIFLLFGILGLQQYAGIFYQRCRLSADLAKGKWPYEQGQDRLCSMDGSGMYSCPAGMVCGTPLDQGLPTASDAPRNQPLINYGITNFDTMLSGFFTIFQMVTLEGWSQIMYNLMDSSTPWLAIVMCVSLVILCSFFMLNVILAVIVDSMADDGDLENRKLLEKNDALATSIKHAQRVRQEKENAILSPMKKRNMSKKAQRDHKIQKEVIKELKSSSNQVNPVEVSSISADLNSSDVVSYQEELHISQQTKKEAIPCTCRLATRLLHQPIFNILIILVIIANIVVLAMDRVDLPEEQYHLMEQFNFFCEVFFVLELLVKVAGLGCRGYARDFYNVSDAVLVSITMVEWTIELYGSNYGVKSLMIARATRLLRVLKLARQWSAFHNLLRWFGIAFKEATNFVILLLIFYFIFILLGMEFYAHRVRFDATSTHIVPCGAGPPPRTNFNTWTDSLIVLFIICIGDDWQHVMYDHYRAMQTPLEGYLTVIFFSNLFFALNLMMLNLLLAILLKSHSIKPTEEQRLDEAEKEEEAGDIGPMYVCLYSARMKCVRCFERKNEKPDEVAEMESLPQISAMSAFDINDDTMLDLSDVQRTMTTDLSKLSTQKDPLVELQESRQIQHQNRKSIQEQQFGELKMAEHSNLRKIKLRERKINETSSYGTLIGKNPLKGKALFIFGPKNSLRQQLQIFIKHPWFDNFIMLLIFGNTFCLMLRKPLDNQENKTETTLQIIDQIFTVLFLIECLLKIIVGGFLCNGPDSYLNSGWNIIDFFIALFSLSVFLHLPNSFKVVRLLRILKPLRMVNRYPGIRIAVESIIQAVPQFINLAMISAMTLLIFSVLGTTFFKGLFSTCDMKNVPGEVQGSVYTKWECFDRGGEWFTRPDNFDNVSNAMLTLFTAVTTEGWINIMWAGVDTTSMNVMPKKNAAIIMLPYFLTFMMLGSCIFLNLFVGVVVDSNATEKEKILKTTMLTKLQVEYTNTLMKAYQTRPKAVYISKGNACRDTLYKVGTSEVFKWFVLGCILLNTLVMASTWYGEPESLKGTQTVLENFFTGIYIIEAVILISVYQWQYFKDPWRRFDFIIVVSAIANLTAEHLFQFTMGPVATIFRSFRFLVVLKMVKKFRSLYKISNTFVLAAPNLIQAGSLLLLFLVIYAELGVFLFSRIKLQDTLTSHANFQHFGWALLTLFRMTTGESWNLIMWECERSRSILFQCQASGPDQTSDQLQLSGPQACGIGKTATFYFVSFIVICVFIITNMFISAIIDGYNASNDEERMHINDETMDKYTAVWQRYDAGGTGLIQTGDLKGLVTDLVREEVKYIERTKQGTDNYHINCLFNLRLHKYLMLMVSDDTEELNKQWESFFATMQLPTYKQMKYFSFHDTLVALINYSFHVRYSRAFHARLERIEQSRDTGVWLSKWDQMHENSPLFGKLPLIDQEKFLELTEHDFNKVVDRLETKLLRDEIHKLTVMKELRLVADLPLRNELDTFWDGETEVVFDSQVMVAGRFIVRYMRRNMEEIKKKRKERAKVQSVFKEQLKMLEWMTKARKT